LINGAVSENPADTLHLEFKGIDLAPLDFLQNNNNDEDKLAINLKGILNGRILLTNVYKDLLLESNIMINDFSILGSEFGNITVSSELDINQKVLNISASNNYSGVKMFDVSGYYDPVLKKTDLTADVTKLPVTFLNPLLRVFASGIDGTASGRLNFAVEHNKIAFTGAVMAENTLMKACPVGDGF